GQSTSTLGSCQSWLDFSTALTGSFSAVRISSGTDPGQTCSDPAAATQLCNALNTRTTIDISCNGVPWAVTSCGTDINGNPAMEIAGNGEGCYCPDRYAVRPCIGNANWGGVGGAETCFQGSQTITVECVR